MPRYRSRETQRKESTTREPDVDGTKLSEQSAKELLLELWTACQGFVDATRTLKADFDFGESFPEKATLGKNAIGYGKSFATFRALRSIEYEDLKEFRRVARKLRELKLSHNNLVDKRGYLK